MDKPNQPPHSTAPPPSPEAVNEAIPVLTEEDMKENILVGVCGAQAAGKTVFLAAIFHTMNGTHASELGDITIDRDMGGAQHLEDVENEIRATGTSKPTLEPHVARLLVGRDSIGGAQTPRGIILFDFAGKYFTSLADLKAARRDAADDKTKRDIDQVESYIGKCDAFIVLIDSTQFRQGDQPSATSAFSTSVKWVIDRCAKRRTPVALIFTKKDLNPGLTLEKVRPFPRVIEFEERFSTDPQGGQPFGVVAQLSCYTINPHFGGTYQQPDNSIWFPEPGKVFLRVTTVAWAKAIERIQKTIDERAAKEEAEWRAEQRERRSKQLDKWLMAALIVAVIAAVAIYLMVRNAEHTRSDIGAVDAATALLAVNPAQISMFQLGALQRLEKNRGDPSIDEALNRFETGYRTALHRVPEVVYQGDDQAAATDNLLQFSRYASTESADDLKLLQLHKELLKERGNCKQPRLDVANRDPLTYGQVPNAGFVKALVGEADALRAACVNEELGKGYDLEVLDKRLSFIQGKLGEQRNADERLQFARKAWLSEFLGKSLSGLLAGRTVAEFLNAVDPDLGAILTGKGTVEVVSFKFVLEAIQKRDLETSGAIRERMEPLLDNLLNYDPKTSNTIKYTFQQLFVSVKPDQRQGLWSKFFAGVKSQYFFIVASDGWQQGRFPWKDQLESSLSEAKYSDAKTDEVIEALSSRPIYWWEVDTIQRTATERHSETDRKW